MIRPLCGEEQVLHLRVPTAGTGSAAHGFAGQVLPPRSKSEPQHHLSK